MNAVSPKESTFQEIHILHNIFYSWRIQIYSMQMKRKKCGLLNGLDDISVVSGGTSSENPKEVGGF